MGLPSFGKKRFSESACPKIYVNVRRYSASNRQSWPTGKILQARGRNSWADRAALFKCFNTDRVGSAICASERNGATPDCSEGCLFDEAGAASCSFYGARRRSWRHARTTDSLSLAGSKPRRLIHGAAANFVRCKLAHRSRIHTQHR